MELYELDQGVISDLLALISSPTLSIAASQAQRVAELQRILATARPSDALKEALAERDNAGKAAEAMEAQVTDLICERDAARELAVSLEQVIAAAKQQS